jgi:hypothetical protein
MKEVFGVHTFVAAVVGGVLLYLLALVLFSDESNESPGLWIAAGAVVGAGVQTVVRATGVS